MDSKLSFKDRNNNLCKRASQKLNVSAHVSRTRVSKKENSYESICIFGYCPLVWMFHSRGLSNNFFFLHERVLRITYGHKLSLFQDLLEEDNSVSIHHWNIQALATEMFKIKNNIAQVIVKKRFASKMTPYGLRNYN